MNVPLDARFLIIGAGQTNTSMSKFLMKHGFTNFLVFNRTLTRGQELAGELESPAHLLEELNQHKRGFDVIITCTGADKTIIDASTYQSLLNEETDRKIVIDLAVPNDFDESILRDNEVNLIAINNLKEIAEQNLKERQMELVKCEAIIDKRVQDFRTAFRKRQVEIAMKQVPQKVKEIKETALKEVFANDIQKMDEQSKEVLDRVINYIEKKYISEPMKLAKDIMLDGSEN